MTSSRIFVGFLAILLLISGLSSQSPQQTGDIFFEDEGLWVRGDFADFYHAAPDAQRIFGNPISDVMEDPQRPGIQVQYFERVRMDLDPIKPMGQRVSLASLGANLYDENNPGEALDFSTNTNMCRGFPNGRLVCYAFLQFYDSHNGPVFFGQPISDTEVQDGLLVQYFEHARMEWRADRPAGQRVVMTELGRLDYVLRAGGRTNVVNRKVGELTAHAFVEKPVAVDGEEQQVFFVVYDQRGNPVPDVSIIYTVTYPSDPATGKPPAESRYRVEKLTNADGFSSASFPVQNVKPNDMVRISADISLDGVLKTTVQTWFRIWY